MQFKRLMCVLFVCVCMCVRAIMNRDVDTADEDSVCVVHVLLFFFLMPP